MTRAATRKEGSPMIAGGYFDTIAMPKASFTNACSSMGTARTEDHYHVLDRMRSARALGSSDCHPPADALRIFLTLPEGSAPATRYRAELLNENGETKSFETAGQDSRSVSVVIPSAQLARGQYVLKLFKTEADGAEQRVGGSYLFNVE